MVELTVLKKYRLKVIKLTRRNLKDWQGTLEQVDDITVIGFKV